MRFGSRSFRMPRRPAIWTAMNWVIDGLVAGFAAYGEALLVCGHVGRDTSTDDERGDRRLADPGEIS